jgi:putative transposase
MTTKTLTSLQSGCYYHIYNRDNNGEDLFRKSRNYRYFLQLYYYSATLMFSGFARADSGKNVVGSQACAVILWLLYISHCRHICLLRNHFHLLVRIKDSTPQTSQVCSYKTRKARSVTHLLGCFLGPKSTHVLPA